MSSLSCTTSPTRAPSSISRTRFFAADLLEKLKGPSRRRGAADVRGVCMAAGVLRFAAKQKPDRRRLVPLLNMLIVVNNGRRCSCFQHHVYLEERRAAARAGKSIARSSRAADEKPAQQPAEIRRNPTTKRLPKSAEKIPKPAASMGGRHATRPVAEQTGLVAPGVYTTAVLAAPPRRSAGQPAGVT